MWTLREKRRKRWPDGFGKSGRLTDRQLELRLCCSDAFLFHGISMRNSTLSIAVAAAISVRILVLTCRDLYTHSENRRKLRATISRRKGVNVLDGEKNGFVSSEASPSDSLMRLEEGGGGRGEDWQNSNNHRERSAINVRPQHDT